MLYHDTPLKDAYVLEPELREDERGFFARLFDVSEFEERGLNPRIAQMSVSFNHRAGTLRGMHFQVPPAAEAKVVRCTSGAIHDVIVDLRPESETYLSHFAVELTSANRRALYVPEMFAHGFQTLEDETEVAYAISEFHAPEHSEGVAHDDPAFDISWPLPVSVISERDLGWPPLQLRR